MAYALTWSPISRDDLREIVRYIAGDNPERARSFAVRLINSTETLLTQPEWGCIVPEYRRPHFREIIFRPYGNVYRIDHKRPTVEIGRIWHAARGTPEISPT